MEVQEIHDLVERVRGFHTQVGDLLALARYGIQAESRIREVHEQLQHVQQEIRQATLVRDGLKDEVSRLGQELVSTQGHVSAERERLAAEFGDAERTHRERQAALLAERQEVLTAQEALRKSHAEFTAKIQAEQAGLQAALDQARSSFREMIATVVGE